MNFTAKYEINKAYCMISFRFSHYFWNDCVAYHTQATLRRLYFHFENEYTVIHFHVTLLPFHISEDHICYLVLYTCPIVFIQIIFVEVT